MTKVWSLDSEPTLRRFNTRGGPPYSITHDRYAASQDNHGLRHTSRSYQMSSYDDQHDQDSDSEQKGKTRRRIPVACGRCRKRKIRCSGAQGDMGCQNCKTAGVDNCQFNRVSSFETPYVQTNNEYEYDTNIARTVQCRFPPTAPYANQVPYTANANLINSNVYRPSVEYSYPASAKQINYISSYAGEYSDDNAEYSLSSSTYPLLSQDNLNVGSSYAPGSSRIWNPAPHLVKTSTSPAMYYDDGGAGSNYTAQLNYQTHNNFSFTNMASSLPAPSPMACNDRILPPIPTSSRGSIVSYHGVPSQQMMKTSPSTAPMLPASSYIPLSSSPESLHTSHQTYPPIPRSSSHSNVHALSQSQHHQQSQVQNHQTDIYAPTSTDAWTATTISEPTLRSHGSNAELYYSPSSRVDRKQSQSAQSSEGTGGSNGAGLLTNGQAYVVPYSEAGAMDRVGVELGHGHGGRGGVVVGRPIHRGSNASLRA